MSWRATVSCSRAQAEAIAAAGGDDLFAEGHFLPVLVADEPDPAKPDSWLIHAYLEREPTSDEINALSRLGSGLATVQQLGEEDWVARSQAGLKPIRAGRFHVHTPTHSRDNSRINFEIDAGLAFGTGQHATTAGCLEELDQLKESKAHFSNIADIGTGTGLLAFAALALWPDAKCIATDIDRLAVRVAQDNAVINGVVVGHGPGELLICESDGMGSPLLSARAPFDLLLANILAGPLVNLAVGFSAAVARGGSIILAGLLATQCDAVQSAYEAEGLRLAHRRKGEWPVLRMIKVH